MAANGLAMEQIRDAIKELSPLGIAIVIRGEPGVGKSFLARTIHKLSGRTGAFVTLNCGEQSADQIETDLFGCENGKSVEATASRVGAIEAASGGTVFLEEIGRMCPQLQVKLLRAVQNREVVPVGATTPRPIDARFISSTSHDLAAACSDGSFRTDLLLRLNGVTLEIPPLRARTDEIPRLVATFTNAFRGEFPIPLSNRVAPDAMELLLRYPWPGNIGELKKVIGRALLLSRGSAISPEDLTVEMRVAIVDLAARQKGVSGTLGDAVRACVATGPESSREQASPFQSPEEMTERQRILDALEGTARAQRRSNLGNTRRDLLSRKCSLCGQLEKTVRALISGPRVQICDECVEESQRITYGAEQRSGPVSCPSGRSPIEGSQVSCTFCGKGSTQARHLVGGASALICDQCLDICDEILGERFSGEGPPGVGDAKQLNEPPDRRSWIRNLFSDADVGVLSRGEAASHGMLLRSSRAIDELPVSSLPTAGGESCQDGPRPLVMRRKTFTLRTVYPATTVDARIVQARDQLCHDSPCRIVILVDDGEQEAARSLFDHVRIALNDVAELQEQDAAIRGAALTALAIPRSGSVRP